MIGLTLSLTMVTSMGDGSNSPSGETYTRLYEYTAIKKILTEIYSKI